jgi:hypothetical protein
MATDDRGPTRQDILLRREIRASEGVQGMIAPTPLRHRFYF